MYEKTFLGVRLAPPSGTKELLCHAAHYPVSFAVDDDELDLESDMDDIPLIDDVNGTPVIYALASGSNALLSEVPVASADYEAQVIDRLDCIAVSAILSTCILFLVLIRSIRG